MGSEKSRRASSRERAQIRIIAEFFSSDDEAKRTEQLLRKKGFKRLTVLRSTSDEGEFSVEGNVRSLNRHQLNTLGKVLLTGETLVAAEALPGEVSPILAL